LKFTPRRADKILVLLQVTPFIPIPEPSCRPPARERVVHWVIMEIHESGKNNSFCFDNAKAAVLGFLCRDGVDSTTLDDKPRVWNDFVWGHKGSTQCKVLRASKVYRQDDE
jgi:hypothetical protein